MNPDLSYASQSGEPVPSPAPKNIFSRITGVWFSPGETFAEIGRAPRVLVPIIVLMVIGSLGGYLMIERIGLQTFFGKQFEQAVAKGQMSQEDADKQLGVMTSGPVATITRLSFPIIGLIQYPIMALILAGICKLITMLIGGDNRFKPLMSVTLYTLLAVGIVTFVLFVAVLYLKAPEDIDVNNMIGSNLAALLSLAFGQDGLPKFIMTLARWIDIFAIWMIVLLAIGYAAVSQKVKTATIGWALGGLYIVVALLASAVAAVRG